VVGAEPPQPRPKKPVKKRWKVKQKKEGIEIKYSREDSAFI
jgi:hypothetical protein